MRGLIPDHVNGEKKALLRWTKLTSMISTPLKELVFDYQLKDILSAYQREIYVNNFLILEGGYL